MITRLRDRGERALLDLITRLVRPARAVPLGPGDDAAVLARISGPLLITTDALIERVHFRSGWLSSRMLGRRAFAVSASDVAAMGGRVVAAVLAVAAPETLPVASLRAIIEGFDREARAAGGALVGGNLARARDLSLTVTVLGAAPARPVTRAGARPGDHLFVTGTLGGAALGLRLLLETPSISRTAAVRRWQMPAARLRAGAALARRGLVAAMIDVSDGLLIDADRLCTASGVGARIDVARLPLPPALRRLDTAAARTLALRGGEDYELLFAVPPAKLRALRAARAALGCEITRIGELVTGREVTIHDDRGATAAVALGHDHFQRARGGRIGAP